MKISKAFKVELDPTKEQKVLMNKTFGCVRLIYNKGIDRKQQYYKTTQKSLSNTLLSVELTKMKETEEYTFLNEISSIALQQSLRNVEYAYQNFFRDLKKGKISYPRFKCKGKTRDSFRLQNNGFSVGTNYITLAKLGDVKLKEIDYIPVDAKMNNVTVSRQADRYFVSVNCEIDIPEPKKPESVIGLDVGIKTLVVVSNGQTYKNSKNTKRFAKKLRRRQRVISRRIKGSNNRKKAIRHVQKLHYKLSNCRRDNLHKITSILVLGENQTKMDCYRGSQC